MKKNNLSWILGLLFVMALGVASCSDEFNEEEFIQKQADLAESKAAADHQRALEVIQAQLQATLAAIEAQKEADTELAQLQALLQQELQMLMQSLQDKEDSTAAANYLAAYRAAGLFTEFTVVVNDRDGEPLADAEVRVSSIADAVTTGADGMAVFTDVVVGNNTLTVTSDAITDFRATLTFNRTSTVISVGNNGYISNPQTASLSLNLTSEAATSEEVGTIAGVVTIETDLTNDTPEFPADAVVSADLTGYINSLNIIASSDGLGGISGLAWTEGSFGVGEIDPATGEYELVVPATTNGNNVSLIFPEITADQTLAISERDGNEIPAEIATVPARFKLASNVDPLPGVRNYDWTVNEPAEMGEGFELGFSPRPSLIASVFQTNSTSTTLFAGGDVINGDNDEQARALVSITSRGSGYQYSPVIRDNDLDSIGYGYLRGVLSSVSIVSGGSGLGDTQDYSIDVDLYSNGGVIQSYFNLGTVTTNSSGVVSVVELNESAFFVDPNNPWDQRNQIFNRLDSVVVRDITGGTTDAVLSGSMSFDLVGLRITPNDDKYTSNPVLTFVGGGATSQATLSYEMAFYQNITIANAGSNYSVLPQDFRIEGEVDLGAQTQNALVSSISVDNGVFISTFQSIDNYLVLDGNGGIRFSDPSFEFWTSYGYTSEPNTVVTQPDRVLFEPVFTLVGQDNDELQLDLGSTNFGGPYNSPRELIITERIAGMGGSGYSLTLSESLDKNTGIYSYQFINSEDGGTGYTDNLNKVKSNLNNPNSPVGPRLPDGLNNGTTELVFVTRGQTTTVNKDYGTGVRLENVGGDN